MANGPETLGGEVAAVDLGSNSFHMLVARDSGGRLQVLDRLRESVRLAGGLTAEGGLSDPVRSRALECLQRFGQRLSGIAPHRVRVVGTNTMRRLRDGGEFMAEAERALGHPIEVIAGVEEARLVYHGVTHGLLPPDARRLVVDIGGGSTELIIGRAAVPRLMESVNMGCVTHTQRFFADGVITRTRMRDARLAARVELESLERRYRRAGWDLAIGSSGTVRGIWRVMRARGWTDDKITLEALEKVIALVVRAERIDKIDFEGLREDRRPVFAGGVAVLAGVFDSLELDEMDTSECALREGVLYDLLGRLSDRDVRSESVAMLAERYGVDQRHAADVERTALQTLEQVAPEWHLDLNICRPLLAWAARLHEIGLVIAHASYHRHGEYILRHADLFGFSLTDQRLLATLVRLHRGKFSSSALEDVPASWRQSLQRLALLLRLAVLLHRSRTPVAKLPVKLKVNGSRVELQLRKGWLDDHPLTRADLELETEQLASVGVRFSFS